MYTSYNRVQAKAVKMVGKTFKQVLFNVATGMCQNHKYALMFRLNDLLYFLSG